MKKFFYEYLYTKIHKLYKQLDDAATTLCSLKSSLDEMGNILEHEYKNKYKTGFEKGIYGTLNPCIKKDCTQNSGTKK